MVILLPLRLRCRKEKQLWLLQFDVDACSSWKEKGVRRKRLELKVKTEIKSKVLNERVKSKFTDLTILLRLVR